jgi:hypothetical protein
VQEDVRVIVNGSQLCCLNSLEVLAGTLRGLVVKAAEDYMRGHPRRRPPVVRLALRPPSVLFAMRTDMCGAVQAVGLRLEQGLGSG